jgi:hypothetical protein
VANPNEAHITLTNNGHIKSTDCWCEPSTIYWTKNKHGIIILVVEHIDDTLDARSKVISNREAMQDCVTRITSLKESE